MEKFNVKKEYYFALTLDRSSAQPMIITSSKGGVSIEAVAQENPEVIYKHPVDPGKGLTRVEALLIAKELELGELSEEVSEGAEGYRD